MGVKPDWNLLGPKDVAGAILCPALVVSDNKGVAIFFQACLVGNLLVTAELLGSLEARSAYD